MPHPNVILAALPSPDDAPEIAIVNDVVILGYSDHAAYARRVSGDVEALRRIGGEKLVESWSPAAGPLDRHVHLRFPTVG